MDANKVIESRKYRIYPTIEQQAKIIEYINYNRMMWNVMLAEIYKPIIEVAKKEKKSLYSYLRHMSYEDKQKLVKPLSKLTPKMIYDVETKLKFGDTASYGYTKKTLKIAFDNHFKNPKHFKMPRFKRYQDNIYAGSYTTNAGKFCYFKDEHIFKISKIGDNNINNHYESDGRAFKVTISRTSDNQFYISISYEQDEHTKIFPKTGNVIGIDLNASNSQAITLSDGTFITRPDVNKLLNKIDWESHKLGIKRDKLKQSWAQHITLHPDDTMSFVEYLQTCSNYQKNRLKLASLHHKLRNIYDYWIKTTTSELVKKYDTISIEDLSTTKMLSDHNFARLIAQSHFRELRTHLEYKTAWNDKTLVVVPAENTSQRCSNCDYLMTGDEKLKLSDKQWTCPNCHQHHINDVNASKNILNDGLKQLSVQ